MMRYVTVKCANLISFADKPILLFATVFALLLTWCLRGFSGM